MPIIDHALSFYNFFIEKFDSYRGKLLQTDLYFISKRINITNSASETSYRLSERVEVSIENKLKE